MTELKRLRNSTGPTGVLMSGAAVMRVPSDARRRAVAFTSAAASVVASSGVAAASTATLFKSFLICMGIGVAGGGVMSLAASETVARLAPVESAAAPARPLGATTGRAAPAESAPVDDSVPPPDEPELPSRAPELEAQASPSRSKPAAASTTSSASAAPASSALGGSLFEEQRFVESARAAVARGDAREALNTLDGYERAFARRQFGPEALALRVEALRSAGQITTARKLASDFARLYPNHPLRLRVEELSQR